MPIYLNEETSRGLLINCSFICSDTDSCSDERLSFLVSSLLYFIDEMLRHSSRLACGIGGIGVRDLLQKVVQPRISFVNMLEEPLRLRGGLRKIISMT
jgi:hypothetical protein